MGGGGGGGGGKWLNEVRTICYIAVLPYAFSGGGGGGGKTHSLKVAYSLLI